MHPHGDKGDFTHCDMGTLFIEDADRGCGRGRGRGRSWLNEDVTERNLGGG